MRYVNIIIGLVSLCLAQDANECSDRNWHSFETDESSRSNCGPVFENRCHCKMTCFERTHRYVVNCTDADFHDTTPLSHLSEKTEVSIFHTMLLLIIIFCMITVFTDEA